MTSSKRYATGSIVLYVLQLLGKKMQWAMHYYSKLANEDVPINQQVPAISCKLYN